MNDEQLRDLLLSAHESVPASGFDPADDVERARQARSRRRVARTGVGATAAVVGVTLALSLLPRVDDALGTLSPAAGGPGVATGTPTATEAPRAPVPTAKVGATPNATTLTSEELLQRMEAAIRANAAGSARYLRPRNGTDAGTDGRELERVGVHAPWAKAGESKLGEIRVMSAAATDPDSYQCGGIRSQLEPSECTLVAQRKGTKIYYGSKPGTRAASITYADGRQVAVIASDLQGGNSLAPTTVPLPTKEELIAIASEPGLAWPGVLEDNLKLWKHWERPDVEQTPPAG